MFLNTKTFHHKKEGGFGMSRILIATVYANEPVTVSATKLGVDRIILLIDKNPDKTMEESLNIIKKSVGPIVETKKTELYDIVKIVDEAIKIIDDLNENDEIYVNITAGRKTKALGLLYASYLRSKKIKKIVYVTEETKDMITLPKLSFNLKPAQKKILEYIHKHGLSSITKAADETEIPRSMFYSNLDELRDMGLVEGKDEVKLTEAGMIARL